MDPNELFTAVLAKLNGSNIEGDTPAAAALRANREVKVPKVGKVAQSFHTETI